VSWPSLQILLYLPFLGKGMDTSIFEGIIRKGWDTKGK